MYSPTLTGGTWERLYSVPTAISTQEFEIPVPTGLSKTAEQQFGPEVAASVSKSFSGIEASLNTKFTFSDIASTVFDASRSKSHTFTVERGQSVTVWQWIIFGAYAGHGVQFASNILAHTSSYLKMPPKIL